MARKKGLAAELIEFGVKLAVDASERLLGDPRGQGAVAAASELAQKALRKLEELQASATRSGAAPTREELRDLEEQVERIQRQARDLRARLDEISSGHRTHGAASRWRDPDDSEPR